MTRRRRACCQRQHLVADVSAQVNASNVVPSEMVTSVAAIKESSGKLPRSSGPSTTLRSD